MTNPRSSIERLADVLEFLVDDRVGVIRFVQELPREAGAPNFFHFWTRVCDTRAFTRQSNFPRCGGASVNRSIALAKAVGESLERYCCAIYEREDFALTTYERADFPCVPPAEFALFSSDQYSRPDFPFVPFQNDAAVRWVPSWDSTATQVRHVPAAMVYLPYTPDVQAGERRITQPISTGLACQDSRAKAAVAAICEVVERDAFTITWQARLARTVIRTESLDKTLIDLVDRFEKAGFAITLLNLTMESGVPTILAMARGRTPDSAPLAVATATALNPRQAAIKSLEELEHTRHYCQILTRRLINNGRRPEADAVANQADHLTFWCDRENIRNADFLLASQDRMDLDELENLATSTPETDLGTITERIHKVGHRVLLVDVTTPDVRELGFHVVRAIIPGFHPLIIGHRIRALGGRRLWEAPQRLGYSGITPDSGDNPFPHPFP